MRVGAWSLLAASKYKPHQHKSTKALGSILETAQLKIRTGNFRVGIRKLLLDSKHRYHYQYIRVDNLVAGESALP